MEVGICVSVAVITLVSFSFNSIYILYTWSSVTYTALSYTVLHVLHALRQGRQLHLHFSSMYLPAGQHGNLSRFRELLLKTP